MERAEQTERRHITGSEAWTELGIPEGTIRAWASQGRLHAVSIDGNRQRWYLLSDVLRLAAATRRRGSHSRPGRSRCAQVSGDIALARP